MKNTKPEEAKFRSFAPSAEMRSLLEHSDRSIIMLDRDFRILWFNSKAAEDMFSYAKEDLKTGNSYWDYVERDINKRFIRNFQAALKGRTISVQQRVPKPRDSQGEMWIDGRFSPLTDSNGNINGVVYSHKNITDQKRAEEEKTQQDMVIQAIDRNESQGFLLLNGTERIIHCNLLSSALLASDRVRRDPYKCDILDCIHAEWRDAFKAGLQVAQSGGSVSMEFVHPSAQRKVIELRFTPVKDRLGKQHLVAVWANDITEKIEDREKLRTSEQNLRSVFNSSSQTFYLLDRQLNILAFNQAATDLVQEQFGIELKPGMNVVDITAKDNLVQFRIETERAFSGRKVHVEKHFSFNGKNYWFDRHINPVYNDKGEVDRIALWSIDITERKLAEKALKENESKFRKLASLLPVGIYQVDEKGNTIYINESLQLILGMSMIPILNGSWTEKIHPEDVEMVKNKWDAVEREKEMFNMEYRFIKDGDTVVHILEQAQPLFDHLGAYKGYVGTVIDITEQKKTQKLMRDKEVAERSLRFRSDFLASMSHEIRTPLNGIMALTELLLHTDLGSAQRSKLMNILDASKDLRSIVNDVLNLSELEAGKVVLDIQPFKITDLLNTISERYGPEAESKGLHLKVGPVADPIMLHTDKRRTTQVLSNLVRNAIKFTDKGSVNLTVQQNDRDQLVFRVTDTGPGIPESDKEKLFQDFSQLQHTTAQNLEGTGLGLSISKKLVSLLGGEIGVESTVGKGSTFWFSIPMTDRKEDVAPSSEQLPESEKDLKGVRVLLVEDNLINQQAFKVMLKKMGCQVDVCSNGRQALERFAPDTYDVVFMDIQMPVMDGLQASSELKKKFSPVPPIIGLSGNVIERSPEGGLMSDMDDLLLKPVVSHDIERMLKKWVR